MLKISNPLDVSLQILCRPVAELEITHQSCLIAGVLTCDPRIVPEAEPVPLLTFDEAAELAHFGAQVLHPQAMQPARIKKHMAVRVKNSYNRYDNWSKII